MEEEIKYWNEERNEEVEVSESKREFREKRKKRKAKMENLGEENG